MQSGVSKYPRHLEIHHKTLITKDLRDGGVGNFLEKIRLIAYNFLVVDSQFGFLEIDTSARLK